MNYHDRPEISRSMLATLLESPRKYEAGLFGGDESDALTIGTGTHAINLKDVIELGKIVVIPKEVLASNGAKSTNAYKEFEAANFGKTLIKAEQIDLCRRLSKAIDDEIGPMIHSPNAVREQETYWRRGSLDLRCKLDCVLPMPGGLFPEPWHEPHLLVLDLKTARSVEKWAWWRAVRDNKYWLQDAFYSMSVESEYQCSNVRFAFVCVEKTEPYRVRMFELSQHDRIKATAKTESLLDDLERRISENDWSEEGEGLINLMMSMGDIE